MENEHADIRLLIIDKATEYGNELCKNLTAFSTTCISVSSVNEFLDLNYAARIDLVVLDVDVFHAEALDDLVRLRTHFGEGPSTRIVAVSTFAPRSFPELIQQRGADTYHPKETSVADMASVLGTEIALFQSQRADAARYGYLTEIDKWTVAQTIIWGPLLG